MKIGVIGLGRMGGNIVRRLMQAGHSCVVYDANPAAGFDERAVLSLGASLERASEHPLAAAIIASAKERGVELKDAAGWKHTKPARCPESGKPGRSRIP